MKNYNLILIIILIIYPFFVLAQTVEKEEYLIITRPMFVESLNDFVAFKQSKGLNVKVVIVEDIINRQYGRDIQEKIRNYVISEYKANNLKWLLIVGKPDAEDNIEINNNLPTIIDKQWEIPIRYVYCPSTHDVSKYVSTDMYYSCLDGDWDYNGNNLFGEISQRDICCSVDEIDFVPELSIGRIPVKDIVQLKNYIKKVKGNDYSTISENDINNLQIQCKVIVADDKAVNGKILSDLPEHEKSTTENILKSLNSNNYKLITYTGHGNSSGIGMDNGNFWGGEGLTGKPFFMYNSSCSTAEIDIDNGILSMAEKLLFQENTGALGYIGANRLAFAYNMNDLWEEFWRTYYDDGISTIGKTLDVTRSKYFLLNVENSYMYEYRYLPMAFNLLGDPSLKIGNIQENGPIIKSIPSMIFSSGQNYQYDYDNQAVAIGEGNITWTKVSGPEFFNIQQDGLVDWIPNVGSEKNNYGRPTIIIKASDENGSTNQKFTSAMINNYFVIDSKPNIIATLNKEYFYNENKKATNSFQKWPYSLDPAPKWKLMKGPKGFSIDNNTGEIKWLPTQLGEFEVIIYSYYKSWINSQQFFIKVNPIDQDSIKANFFAEKYNGVVPFEVKFHERSLGKVSKWKWDFGDGMTSSESNPIHTYLKGDTLSVKLIVYGESSKDSIVRNNYIVALPEPPPIANFTATNRIAKNYSEVQFTNLTSNTSNKWTWNFGDGTTSTEKNPIHKYSSPGSYDVKLFSKGPYGENEKIKYHYINIYDSLKDTIISVWEFNDKTDVLTDSKNGINGKVNGASWNKECDKSNLHFDGIDDYVLIGDNENFNPDFITIEAMVKIDSYKKATIIDRWGDWGQFSIGLGDFNGNEIDHLFFSILPDPNILAGIHSVRCEKTIPLNQWIHIAGVFDGDSMKVYMDYKKMGAFEFSGKLGSHSSDLFIGCGFFGAYTVRPIDMRFFNGDIAEVRISRYPLQPKDFLKRISSLTAPIISQTGDVLHSNATSGNQWYNKDVLIAGAVNQDYTPKTSGEYYVVVSTDCGSVSSDKIKFIPTAIESFESNKPNLNVYPNPVTSEVTLKYAGNAKTIEFELLNSIGQVVYKGNIVEEAIVPMFGFLPGVYLVRLKSGEAVNIKKIIKAD